jgi:hypothetical protein
MSREDDNVQIGDADEIIEIVPIELPDDEEQPITNDPAYAPEEEPIDV